MKSHKNARFLIFAIMLLILPNGETHAKKYRENTSWETDLSFKKEVFASKSRKVNKDWYNTEYATFTDTTITDESRLLTVKFTGIPETVERGDTVSVKVQVTVKQLLYDLKKEVLLAADAIPTDTFIPLGASIGLTDFDLSKTSKGIYEGSVQYFCVEVGDGSFKGKIVVQLPDDAGFSKDLDVNYNIPVKCIGKEEENYRVSIRSFYSEQTGPNQVNYKLEAYINSGDPADYTFTINPGDDSGTQEVALKKKDEGSIMAGQYKHDLLNRTIVPIRPEALVVDRTGAIIDRKSFEIQKATLTIEKRGSGEGTVFGKAFDLAEVINCGSDCNESLNRIRLRGLGPSGNSIPVILEAKPESGSIFIGWSGYDNYAVSSKNCDATGPCEVRLIEDRTITATFGKDTTRPLDSKSYISFADTRTLNFPRSDAAPSEKGKGFVELGGNVFNFEFDNIFDLNIQAEYAVAPNIAFGAEIGYRTIIPDDDQLDNLTGFKDPMLSGWFSPYSNDRTNVAVGGQIVLPMGNEEELRQGNFDFGAFGTIRHQFTDNLVGIGQVSIDFREPFFEEEDREALLGGRGSLIYGLSDGVNLFAEGRLLQEPEFAFRDSQFNNAKIGVGYNTPISIDFRAALGTGFGDFGPDSFFEFKIGKSINCFNR